jgi:hypothetical protein
MYEQLLRPGEELLKFDSITRLEIQDYINMRKMAIVHDARWKSIRSLHCTTFGMTLWQISEKWLDSQKSRAIGQLESPVSLFEWILNNN